MLNVPYKKLNTNAKPFAYTRVGDACMDVYALASGEVQPGEAVIIPTGIAMEIPQGYEGIIRGRSGLASKGVHVHIGTVDANYRGDIGVILTNLSGNTFTYDKHARIAQFTVKPITYVDLQEATDLSDTVRGSEGFGSSGI